MKEMESQKGLKYSQKNFVLAEVMRKLQINLIYWLRFHQVRQSYQVGYIQGEGSGRMVREFLHGSFHDHGVCDLILKGNMQVHEPILLQEFQKMNWKVQVQYLKA